VHLACPTERGVRKGRRDARGDADHDDETGRAADSPSTAAAIAFVEGAREVGEGARLTARSGTTGPGHGASWYANLTGT
jgi:hypothetical protein